MYLTKLLQSHVDVNICRHAKVNKKKIELQTINVLDYSTGKEGTFPHNSFLLTKTPGKIKEIIK